MILNARFRQHPAPLHLWSFCIAFLCGALLSPSLGNAQRFDRAVTPAWLSTVTNADSRQDDASLQLAGNSLNLSHPVVGDLDGNLTNGLEVVAASANGTISVFGADGTLRFALNTPNFRCSGSSNRLLSSPAIGELFGDGRKFIVIGYGGVGTELCEGGVIAYSGVDGSVLWNFGLKRFARKKRFGTRSHTVFSTPALADSDGDGQMEIAFGSYDRNIYLLNANGSVRWYYNAADTIWSSLVFANIDSDSELELIAGTDISRNDRLRPPTKDGGLLYAFDTRTRNGARIGFRERSAYSWMTAFDQVLYASPVFAELDPTNPGGEIALASGCFFPQNSPNKRGKWLKIIAARTGRVLRTIPMPRCTTMSPAVADLNGDGLNELVAVQPGGSVGLLTALDPRTGATLWSVAPRDRGRNDSTLGNFISPVVADLDGNGSLEVVFGHGNIISVFAGATGVPLTCQVEARECSTPLLKAPGAFRSTVTIADLDQDGVLDVVAAGSAGGSGRLFGFTSFATGISSEPGVLPPFSAPFPMWRGGPTRNAVVSQ